jgi:hypothetical protein
MMKNQCSHIASSQAASVPAAAVLLLLMQLSNLGTTAIEIMTQLGVAIHQ